MNDKKQLTAVERLDREYAQKRAELERNLALAAKLPTHGKTFSWIGDGGYVGNDKQPDKEKSVPLDPWIFYGTFRGTQHVGYRAPEEYPDYGELARAMRRAYVQSVCDAFEPCIVGILAIKGQYASNVHAFYDYKSNRDYADAVVRATGRAELTIDASAEHGYQSAKLEFYANLSDADHEPEIVQVSIDVPYAYKLAPHAVGVERYGNGGPVSRVARWDVPATRAIHHWRRGSGEHSNKSCTVEYLYPNVATALEDIYG